MKLLSLVLAKKASSPHRLRVPIGPEPTCQALFQPNKLCVKHSRARKRIIAVQKADREFNIGLLSGDPDFERPSFSAEVCWESSP